MNRLQENIEEAKTAKAEAISIGLDAMEVENELVDRLAKTVELLSSVVIDLANDLKRRPNNLKRQTRY